MEHEASTSKIGEDQLFYFQQRGIAMEEAVAMIISGAQNPFLFHNPSVGACLVIWFACVHVCRLSVVRWEVRSMTGGGASPGSPQTAHLDMRSCAACAWHPRADV